MFTFLNRHIACMFVAWLLITVPYWAMVRFGDSEVTALETAGGMCVVFTLIGTALLPKYWITGNAILATALMSLAFVIDRIINTAGETSFGLGLGVTLFATAFASIVIMQLGRKTPKIRGTRPGTSEVVEFREAGTIVSFMSWWYFLLIPSALTFTMRTPSGPLSTELLFIVMVALAPNFAGLVYFLPKPVSAETPHSDTSPAPSFGDSSPVPLVH